jgi:dipeptidase D
VWLEPDDADRVISILDHPDVLRGISDHILVGREMISLGARLANEAAAPLPLLRELSESILHAIISIPWGPQKMSHLVSGLVETSNNVAVVSTSATEITLTCSTRTSKEGAIVEFQSAQAKALEESGATVTFSDGYPGWEADTENPLLKQAEKTFTRILGTPPKITAVHAGLECGVIKGIIPDMRMISFGPDILDAHTILERVLLKSVPSFYHCLKALLQDLCT